jgi:hypothetical protein
MTMFLTTLFINGAGAITLLAFLLTVYCVWDLYRAEIKDWKAWAPILAVSFLGATIVFLSVAVDFKVLSDETNLLSVANMLTQFGKASNTEMWSFYYRTFHAFDVNVPTRPILFPLLTALVHAVNGMKWWSPFVVNYFCLGGLFFLTLQWAKRLDAVVYPRTLAFFALLMSPVLVINATSAGFDLCSLFFAFLCGVLLEKHWRENSEATERTLFLALVCFASVRYESILALPLVGCALLYKNGQKAINYGLFSFCLFLLVPLFLQRYLTWGSFENPAGVAPFSPMHFVNHMPSFMQAFFLDPRGPYPVLLHWLGVLGLLTSIPKLKGPGRIVLGYGIFLFVLLLSHHFGFAGHPTQARLFMPLSFGLCLFALKFLSDQKNSLDGRALIGVFFILFFHHHQYAISDPLTTQLTMTREMRHVRDYIDKHGAAGDLWVYDRPGQLSAIGESSISINHFKQNQRSFFENLEKGLYQRMLMIDHVRYLVEKPEVTPGYRLVPILYHQMTPEDALRISRIEPVTDAQAPAVPGRQ